MVMMVENDDRVGGFAYDGGFDGVVVMVTSMMLICWDVMYCT